MNTTFLLTLACCLLSLTVDAQTFERYREPVETALPSDSLGYEKKIAVTLPLDFEENGMRQFPVIVLFDSQDTRNYNYLLHTIDYLTANEQMPSSIIVGISSDERLRYSETQFALSDPQGKGELMEQFLMKDLLPQIRSTYNGSLFTTLIGHGRYGYFATSLLTRGYPEIRAVIAFSPFLEQKNVSLVNALAARLKKTPAVSTTYFRYAYGSDGAESNELLEALFSHSSKTKTHMDASGVLFADADHTATPGMYASQALYEIFQFWSTRQNTYFNPEATQLPTMVSQIDAAVEAHYGQAIGLSLGALNGKGWALYNAGNFEQSIEAWQLLLRYYPHFSEAYLSIAYAQKDLQQPIDSTLRLFEENLHSSHFYSDSEQLDLMEEYKLLLSIPETEKN